MDESVYVFNLLAALLYAVVGARLLALSRRTRARPEKLLAANYLATGFSYVLYEHAGLIGLELQWVLVAGRILFAIGIIPLLLFTRDVFRRGSRWANALTWSTLIAMYVGVLFSTLEGDIEGVVITSPWFWCDWAGYMIPYVWISAEALIARSAALKRARIGLCDAETANRFLLWALFGAFASIAGLSLIPLYIEYDATQIWPLWGDFVSGGCEAASTLMLWLAFFPPAGYRRWLNRASRPTPDVER
jgi:hypothetical protein